MWLTIARCVQNTLSSSRTMPAMWVATIMEPVGGGREGYAYINISDVYCHSHEYGVSMCICHLIAAIQLTESVPRITRTCAHFYHIIPVASSWYTHTALLTHTHTHTHTQPQGCRHLLEKDVFVSLTNFLLGPSPKASEPQPVSHRTHRISYYTQCSSVYYKQSGSVICIYTGI